MNQKKDYISIDDKLLEVGKEKIRIPENLAKSTYDRVIDYKSKDQVRSKNHFMTILILLMIFLGNILGTGAITICFYQGLMRLSYILFYNASVVVISILLVITFKDELCRGIKALGNLN